MGDQEMTRAEEVAKRATELAARAEDLARHAHEVVGVDEQLAALEAELDALAAEEAALDDGDVGGDEFGGGPHEPGDDRQYRERHYRDRRDEAGDYGHAGGDWAAWTGSFGDRMEALGYRLGDLISGSLDAAFHSPFAEQAPGGREWPHFSAHEKVVPVAGPVPVKVVSGGGNVNVRLGTADRVLVGWRTRGWPAGHADQEPVTVTDDEGTVMVRSSGGRRWRQSGVQIDIEVPVHSPVDVTTGGGSLQIVGTQAAVRAHTGGGPIHIGDADGPVSASTGGGNVEVAGRLSGASSVRTGGGPVTVLLRPGTCIDLEAHGTPATIDVPGLDVQGFHVSGAIGGGGDGRLEVRTGGGRATITQG